MNLWGRVNLIKMDYYFRIVIIPRVISFKDFEQINWFKASNVKKSKLLYFLYLN